MESYTYPVKEG